MAKLIGNEPNQVPTNGDLGTMAFQDAESPLLVAPTVNLLKTEPKDKADSSDDVAVKGVMLTKQGNFGEPLYFSAEDFGFEAGDQLVIVGHFYGSNTRYNDTTGSSHIWIVNGEFSETYTAMNITTVVDQISSGGSSNINLNIAWDSANERFSFTPAWAYSSKAANVTFVGQVTKGLG